MVTGRIEMNGGRESKLNIGHKNMLYTFQICCCWWWWWINDTRGRMWPKFPDIVLKLRKTLNQENGLTDNGTRTRCVRGNDVTLRPPRWSLYAEKDLWAIILTLTSHMAVAVLAIGIRWSSPPTNLNWLCFYFIFKILSLSLFIVLNFIFVI